MPYIQQYVDAELFLEHNGVSVYYTYKNDYFEMNRHDFLYVLDPSHGEDDAFDVRDLSTWVEAATLEAAITKAIETGELKP